jgi:hypothetical protein
MACIREFEYSKNYQHSEYFFELFRNYLFRKSIYKPTSIINVNNYFSTLFLVFSEHFSQPICYFS